MATLALITYTDLLQHLRDYLGDNPGARADRDARRAIQSAYRELATGHRWSYYYQKDRINTVDDYSTGTITYTHTGGSSERLLTLSGGTWPTWTAFGSILIDNVAYDIAERKSTTDATLTIRSNPGANLAAGTKYTLYRDTYPMPSDFVAADSFIDLNKLYWPAYIAPGQWLTDHQGQVSPASPRTYTFTSDPNYVGAMAVRFWPPPDDIYSFDFIYQKRPRQLIIDEYKAGTVTVTNNSTTVTGTGTTFASKHVGSVIRLSADATNYPTGIEGSNPASAERTIMSFTSATVLTVDSNFTENLTAVKYLISDPVDIEVGTLMDAFLRCCELHLSIQRRMDTADNRGLARGEYQRALLIAREADSRSFAPRVSGMGHSRSEESWLTGTPMGADVE